MLKNAVRLVIKKESEMRTIVVFMMVSWWRLWEAADQLAQ